MSATAAVQTAKTVRVSTFVECLKAVHLSTYVQSPFSHMCGMFVVGAPGVIKTTLLEFLDPYETVLTLSDINTKMISSVVKSQLTNNSIKTLVLPEVQRIYERDPRTAAGVEGTIRALVEEGYRGATMEDPTVTRFRARACVIGAMTESLRDSNWKRWTDSGFSRRFMWCLIRLADSSVLMDAVEKGKLAQIDGSIVQMNTPPMGSIPALPEAQKKRLRPLVRKQPHPSNVQYELLCRMAAVLTFYYARTGSKKDPMKTIIEFGNCLLGGADLVGLSF